MNKNMLSRLKRLGSRMTPSKSFRALCVMLRKEQSLLLSAVQELPIVWHKTSPTRFECVSGCHGCCTTCFYFQDEYDALPENVRGQVDTHETRRHLAIMKRDKTLQIAVGAFDKCTFFDRAHGCSIHQYRPTRCRVYPYKFIVDVGHGFISVMVDHLVDTPFHRMAPGTLGTLCPGIGRGSSVKRSINRMVRPFLDRLIREKSVSMPFHFWSDVEECFHDEAHTVYKLMLKRHGAVPFSHFKADGSEQTCI